MNARLLRAFILVLLATSVAVVNPPSRHYGFVIGSNPGGHHLTNVALYMANTLILFGLVLRPMVKPQQTLLVDLSE